MHLGYQLWLQREARAAARRMYALTFFAGAITGIVIEAVARWCAT